MFELAEAFVTLSERGFDTALVSVDGVETSLSRLHFTANSATAAFEGTLTASIQNAAGEMGAFTQELDTSTVRMATARLAASELAQTVAEFKALELNVDDADLNTAVESIDKLIAAAESLDDTEIEFLGELENKLSAVVEEGKRIKEIRDAVIAFDAANKPAVQSVKELNDEIAKMAVMKNTVKDLRGELQSLADDLVLDASNRLDEKFEDAKDAANALDEELDEIFDSTESVEDAVKRVGGQLIKGVGAAGAVLAAISATITATESLAKSASGYNSALADSNRLLEEGNRLRDKAFNKYLAAAANLGGEGEVKQLKFLEEVALKNKLATETRAEFLRKHRETIVIPGTEVFLTGKFGGQLDDELEAAEEKAKKAAERFVELQTARENTQAAATQTETDEAARAAENELRLAKQNGDAYQNQLRVLQLRNIELNQGAEAAARARDADAGFNAQQRRELSSIRQANAAKEQADADAKRRADDAQRAVDKEAAAAQRVEDSFARQLRRLQDRNTELKRGAEALAKQKEAAAGFSKEQQDALATLRKQNDAIEDFRDAQERLKELKDQQQQSESAGSSSQFVGFSDLATKFQDAINDPEGKQLQRDIAKATSDLARLASGVGLKVNAKGEVRAPVTNRAFGAGSADGKLQKPGEINGVKVKVDS